MPILAYYSEEEENKGREKERSSEWKSGGSPPPQTVVNKAMWMYLRGWEKDVFEVKTEPSWESLCLALLCRSTTRGVGPEVSLREGSGGRIATRRAVTFGRRSRRRPELESFVLPRRQCYWLPKRGILSRSFLYDALKGCVIVLPVLVRGYSPLPYTDRCCSLLGNPYPFPSYHNSGYLSAIGL